MLSLYYDYEKAAKKKGKGTKEIIVKNFYFPTCKNIKNEMIELNIPYLERKWNNINLNYFGKKIGYVK